MFYHDVKKHMSPSAFAAWYNQRSGFIKSYFLGEKSVETKATLAGKQIHQLIEGNFLPVKHNYQHHERVLEHYIETPEGTFKILGVPDSYERHWTGAKEGEGEPYDTAYFVDYKSGKDNGWDNVKLSGDLKMKLTAWLVWNECGKPPAVKGSIEYLPTVWNPATRNIELIEGEETVVAASITYTSAELSTFTDVIVSTMKEINAAYLEWQDSTDEFVSQEDVAEFAELDRQRVEIEKRQDVIKDRIADQMTMGKKSNLPTLFGSFYFRESKKFTYPPTLPVKLADGQEVDLEGAEAAALEINSAVAAVKKKFETENDPVTVSRSLQFRPKK